MPYRAKVEGMDKLAKMLRELEEKAPRVASAALYVGAGAMQKELARSVQTIRTEPFRYVTEGTRLPSPEEKAVVESGTVGIAKFGKTDDGVDTSVGYSKAGYADLNGKTVPIPKIANAINSGTSFMGKQPFFRKAAKKGEQTASGLIAATIEKNFEKMTEGTK